MKNHPISPHCLLLQWSCMIWIQIVVVDSFMVTHPRLPILPSSPCFTSTTQTSTALSMCICIDCKYVTNCSAYHFVETKHEQPHMTENPTFEPVDGSPTIHVNIRTIRPSSKDVEDATTNGVKRMYLEHEAETKRAEEKRQQQKQDGDEDRISSSSSQSSSSSPSPLVGETVYDIRPVTTYEYDVVKCASFVEDKGAWIRNMPEEIKRSNPNFVPG
jgi:hypothetical protein